MSVAPDLDGLSAIPDVVNRLLGRPATDFYFRHHHFLAHGLPAAMVGAAVGAAFGLKRTRTAALAFVSFHLHLLCDLAGSRGPNPGDTWPIRYLEPLSSRWTLDWGGQWPLNDPRNIGLTLALLGLVLVQAVRLGYSPVGLFSARADRAFVETLRARFGARRPA